MKTTILGLWRAAGFAALAVAAAVPARAADTWDLSRRDVWKPGDVVTTTVSEHDVREYRLVTPEGSSLAVPTQDITTSSKLLERCLEADAAGAKTRSLVFVSAWAARDGVVSDSTLEGALLEVTGTGKERAVRLVSSKQDLSKPATVWMNRRYGGGRAEPGASAAYWLPKVPVSVGDTWSADLAAFLDANAAGTRLDRSKTTSSCALTSVAKGFATITCDANLALSSFPGPGPKGAKPIAWKSGGTQVVKGTITRSVEGRLVAGALAFSTLLEGEAEAGGKTLAISFKSERKIDETIGGDWPAELKAPPPAPPVAPTPPAVPGMG